MIIVRQFLRCCNMESNSRLPAFEMNGKDRAVHQKKWGFSRVLKLRSESDDRIVAGSLFHDAGLAMQTHDHQSWSSNMEPGDCRVRPSGVKNKQCLRRLIGRAHQDNLMQFHGALWRPEDRACIWLAQAHTVNKVKHPRRFQTLTRNKMSVHIALPCVIIGSWSSFILPSQQSSSIHLHVQATEYTIYIVLLCLTKRSLIKPLVNSGIHHNMASQLWGYRI